MPRWTPAEGFGERLVALRARLGFSSRTSFAVALGLSRDVYRWWEVKGVLRKRSAEDLAAGLARFPSITDPVAVATWAVTGNGDLDALVPATSSSTPAELVHRTPPGGHRVAAAIQAHERADRERELARGVVLHLTEQMALDEAVAPDERPRVIAALIRAARKAGYALITGSALLVPSTAEAQVGNASSRRQNFEFCNSKRRNARSSRRTRVA